MMIAETFNSVATGINHFIIFVVVGSILILLILRYGHKFSLDRIGPNPMPLEDSESDSAILSFYSAGHLMTRAGDGMLDDMHFASYVLMPYGVTEAYVDSIAAINVLDLPYNTSTHLIGLSKEHQIDRIKFENFAKANGMEPVVLEGDFGKYFSLYAAKGEQIDVRVVLNPKAMAFVIDYCKTHFWEINASEMYFVASNDDKPGDSDIFKAARDFAKQIQPALKPGTPGAPVVHHQIAYGTYEGPPLACPLCKAEMANNRLWHACPSGHGILITGRELTALHDHTLVLQADASNNVEHDLIICPNCKNQMEHVPYGAAKLNVVLDTCSHCPYRWVDASEIVKLNDGYTEPVKKKALINDDSAYWDKTDRSVDDIDTGTGLF